MNDAASLELGFEGNVPQTAAEIETALREGLLSLDANVLLNFYRYSPNARQALVDVLGAASGRVWVSHQAVKEFWRNRCRAIDERNEATEQLRSSLGKNESAALNSIDTWAKQTAVPEDVKQSVRDAVSDGYRRAGETFEAEIRGAGIVSYDPASDSVLDTLRGLLSANVGPALDSADHAKAVAEAAHRVEKRLPPGYRDAEKLETSHPDGAAGDYLVWLQSMKEATRRDLPLVIVTGDEKEDWWWKHRSVFMGPRPELVEEFAGISSQRLYMLRPVQLIEHAEALNVSVSVEAATDVARASGDASKGWTATAVSELLKRLDAEGWEQAEVIRVAAAQGGIIDREQIYAIAGYSEERMLRGFTRPAARITRDLQAEGILDTGVEAILTPIYDGVTAVQFEIPLDVAEILSTVKDAS